VQVERSHAFEPTRKIANMRRAAPSVVIVAMIHLTALPARANRDSESLRARAASQIYNLDRDDAIESYRRAIAADPQDSAAYRGLATALWLSITFRSGNMTVDEYLVRVTKTNAPPNAPPADTALAFYSALNQSLAVARKRLESNPRDADTHYQIGASIALRASYVATVEGRALGAFRAAREAYDEHETVIEIDPRRKDAGLIVGTYRYIVSALALPARLFAYVVGFGGGRERGISMIEEAAAYPGDNQTDARVALVLLYNREKRYDDALRQLTILREQYPRNRILWLESGSTTLRAGRPGEAMRFLEEGFSKFAKDSRPRMFGEDALWYFKRGTARARLGQTKEAEQDLAKAIATDGRKWVHGRSHLELGKLAIASGNRARANLELQSAVALCEADNDAATAAEARGLLQ